MQRIADDDTGAGICLFLEGPDVGEVRVFLSADALCEGQHEAYLTALGVGVTQARFATGF
ncbi:MAG: hypothetical protein JO060_06800 [Candidatus Eremiobacteraeota bacterium]|nr:hypothetical protein [Candidatus Eremiobacteraeota bacterium]